MRTYQLAAIPFFIISLFVPALTHAQQKAITDGPYIFYRNGMAYVKRVLPADTGYRAVTDSFPEASKTDYEVNVSVEGHPEWDFTVPLKPFIPIQPDSTASRRKH